MNCINTTHPDYLKLKSQAKLKDPVLKAKVSLWQIQNNTDRFPNINELNNLSAIDLTHKDAYANLAENHPKINEATFNQLVNFCKKLNPDFKIEILETLSINGLADINNFAIALQDNSLEQLSEEATHFYLELMRDKTKLNALIDDIQSTEIFHEVFLTYSKYKAYQIDGKPNIEKIAKEAIAKVIAAYINGENFQGMLVYRPESSRASVKGLLNKVRAFIEKLLNIVKRLPMSEYTSIAQKILVGDIAGLSLDQIFDDEYYSVSSLDSTQMLTLKNVNNIPIDLKRFIKPNRGTESIYGKYAIVIDKSSLINGNGEETNFAAELRNALETLSENEKRQILLVSETGSNFNWENLDSKEYDPVGSLEEYKNVLKQKFDLYQGFESLIVVDQDSKDYMTPLSMPIELSTEKITITSVNKDEVTWKFKKNAIKKDTLSEAVDKLDPEQKDKLRTAVKQYGGIYKFIRNRINSKDFKTIFKELNLKNNQDFIIAKLKELENFNESAEEFADYLNSHSDIGYIFQHITNEYNTIFGENSLLSSDEKLKLIHEIKGFLQSYINNVNEILKLFPNNTDSEFYTTLSRNNEIAKLLFTRFENAQVDKLLAGELTKEFEALNRAIIEEYDDAIAAISALNPANAAALIDEREQMKQSMLTFEDEIKSLLKGNVNEVSPILQFLKSAIVSITPLSMTDDKLIQGIISRFNSIIIKSEREAAETAQEFMNENQETIRNLSNNNIDRLKIGKFITFLGWEAIPIDTEYIVYDENGKEVLDETGNVKTIWLKRMSVVPSKQFKSKYDTRYMVLDSVMKNEIDRIEKMLEENCVKINPNSNELVTEELLNRKVEEYRDWRKKNFYGKYKDEVEDSKQAIIDKYNNNNDRIEGENLAFGDYIIKVRNEEYQLIKEKKNALARLLNAADNVDSELLNNKINEIKNEINLINERLRERTFLNIDDSASPEDKKKKDQSKKMQDELKARSEKYYETNTMWKKFYIDLQQKLEGNAFYKSLNLPLILDQIKSFNTVNNTLDNNVIMYEFMNRLTQISSQTYSVEKRKKLDNLVYYVKNFVIFKPTTEYYDEKMLILQQLNEIYFEINPAKFYHVANITGGASLPNINQLVNDTNKIKPDSIRVRADNNGTTRYYLNTKNVKGNLEEKEIGLYKGYLDDNGLECKYYFDSHIIGVNEFVVIKKAQNDNILGLDNADIDTLWAEIIAKVRNYRNQQGEVYGLPLEIQLEVTLLNEKIENVLQELKKEDDNVDKGLKSEIKALIQQLENIQTKKSNYFYYGEFSSHIKDVEFSDSYMTDFKNKVLISPTEFNKNIDKYLEDPYFLSYMSEDLDKIKDDFRIYKEKQKNTIDSAELSEINKKLQEINFKIWFKSNHFVSKYSQFTGTEMVNIEYYRKSYHWLKYEPSSINHIDVQLDPLYTEKQIKSEYLTDESLIDPYGKFVPRDNASFDVSGMELPAAFGTTFGAFSEDWKEFENGYHIERIENPEDGSFTIRKEQIPMIDEIKKIHEATLKLHLDAQKDIYDGRLGFNTTRLHKDVTELGLLNTFINSLLDSKLDKQELGIEGWNSAREKNIKVSWWQKILRWISKFGSFKKGKYIPKSYLDARGLPIRKVPVLYTAQYETSKTITGKKRSFYEFNSDLVTDDVIISTFSYLGETKRVSSIYDEMSFLKLLQERIANPDPSLSNNPKDRNNMLTGYVDQILFRQIEGSGVIWKMIRLMKKWKILFTQSVINPAGNIKNFSAGKLTNGINLEVSSKTEMLAVTHHFEIYKSSITNIAPTKDILLFKMLNPLESKIRDRFNLRTSVFDKNNVDDVLYAGVKQGELHIILQAMYSFLVGKKVMKNGVEMDLYDAIEFEDGELKIDNITNIDGTAVDESIFTEITKELRGFRLRTQGQGSDPVLAKKSAITNLLLFMNSYLVPAIYNHWRISKAHNLNEKRVIAGYISEFFNYSMRVFTEGGIFKAYNYSTKTQKQAIKTAIKSMLIIIVLSALIMYAWGWKNYPDDDDDGELTKAEKQKRFNKLKEKGLGQTMMLYVAIRTLSEMESFALFSPTNKEWLPPLVGDNINAIIGSNTSKGAMLGVKNLLFDISDEIRHQFKIGDDWKWAGIYKKNMPEYGIKKGEHKIVRHLERMLDPTYRIRTFTDKEELDNAIKLIQKFDDSNY